MERRGGHGCVGGGSELGKFEGSAVKIREIPDESSRSCQWSCCEDNASNGAHCLPARRLLGGFDNGSRRVDGLSGASHHQSLIATWWKRR